MIKREKIIILFSLILLIVSSGCSHRVHQQSVDTQADEAKEAKVSDEIKLLNQELEQADHPLRKIVEQKLGITNLATDKKTSFKHANLKLVTRDLSGNTIDAEWKKYVYKVWGGYFLESTQYGTIHAIRIDNNWEISNFIDKSGDDIGAIGEEIITSTESIVVIRQWNEEIQKFVEFDESIQLFNPNQQSIVYIHGMGGHSDTNWIKELAHRIRKLESQSNIIAVDWSAANKLKTSDFYEQQKNNAIGVLSSIAEKNDSSGWIRWGNKFVNTKDIAKKHVDDLLMPVETASKIPEIVNLSNDYLFGSSGLYLEPEQTHIIGFSHGSHIVGMIGMKQAGKIKRITVLDPSTRIVHLKPGNVWGRGWDKGAAKFVDMYATSKLAGTGKIYGHKAFFVSEKKENESIAAKIRDWEVFHTVEDHMYAAKWFLSTIGNNDTRFGYSISTDSVPEEKFIHIYSTLTKEGELDGINDAIVNDYELGK
jgi:hypothetical protein